MDNEINNPLADDESYFFNQDSLKDVLVSEIEIIRDSLSVVNMFVGEPLKAVVEFLKVLERKSTK